MKVGNISTPGRRDKAVGSDPTPSGELQVVKEIGTVAGHTGQSPGHGAGGEAWEVHFSTSYDYKNSLCV